MRRSLQWLSCSLFTVLAAATPALAQEPQAPPQLADEGSDDDAATADVENPPEEVSLSSDEGTDDAASPTAEAAHKPHEVNEAAREQGRKHFRMGVKFYREGNYPAALVEFKRAYEAAPHYKLKFNLGQTALELKDYAYAIENLTAYLREAGDEVPQERGQLVALMIEKLHGRLAMVTLTSNQEGAQVYVDDRLIGTTPFPKVVPIGAGRRRVVAIKDGYVTIERRLSLAAGDRHELALDFEERPTSTKVVVTKVVSDGPSVVVWMGIGTGVLAAGTVTLAILAGMARQEHETELERETTIARLNTFETNAQTRALMTDVGIALTGAAGIATLVVALLEGGDEPDAAPDHKPAGAVGAHLKPAIILAPNRAAVSLAGRF